MEKIELVKFCVEKGRFAFMFSCYFILICASSLILAYFIFLIATKGILINETATFAVYVIGGTWALTQSQKNPSKASYHALKGVA